MAIEPISSMMSVQAQSYTPVRTVEASAQRTAEGDVSEATQAAENVDRATGVVENARAKAESQNDEEQRSSQSEADQIKKAIEKIQKNMPNSEAVFGIHEGTNRVTIKLIDKKTKEVIKELPPEKTLDMIARVWEMAGILVDEKR